MITTTTIDEPASAARRTVAPPLTRLVAAYTKAHVLDLIRTPVAIVSTTVFPTMAFLFFVLPQDEIVSNGTAALVVAAQFAVFGVMASYLFGYGIGVAEDRANPWFTYLRTLPAGGLPSTVARFLTAALAAMLSMLPLVIAIAALTAAPSMFGSGDLPLWRIPFALSAIVVGALPFLGMGLVIGYSMPSKAAIAVAQIVNFPLAFIGGLMLPPEVFPRWLEPFSLATPSRAARDSVVAALTGADAPASTLPVLTAWTLGMFGVALWAYRRDEGRRFR
jgi:ABC-2 type transport system permease protein